MKKRIVTMLSLALTFSLAACSGSSTNTGTASSTAAATTPAASVNTAATTAAAQAETKKAEIEDTVLVIGGGSSGGGSYTIAAAYCDIANKLDHISMSLEETSGGVQSISLIAANELDFGTASTAAGYSAYTGNGSGYKEGEKVENLRAWFPLYNTPFTFVVPASTDIYTVEDLIGKRVCVGEKGNASQNNCHTICQIIGLCKDDGDYNFDAYYTSYSEALDAVKAGKLDALWFGTGAPVPTVQEMEAAMEIRFLEFTEEQMKAVSELHPYFSASVMPAGTYATQTKDIKTLAGYTVAFCNANIDDEVMYQITKAVWENRDQLIAAHATQKNVNGDLIESAMGSLGVPVHPGALRFYHEIGLLTNLK